MSRTLTEIYNQSVQKRNEYLELTELHNDSKMSVLNAITWVTAAAIYSFENLMDVFTVDIAKVFNGRINGTPSYYANAMLKWQMGDQLEINDDGTSFRYPIIDTSKRIISHVSYALTYSSHYHDDVLVLKVAKGAGGELERLDEKELIEAKAYLNQIKFAGVKCDVVSRKGDVLVPRVTVFYDGGCDVATLYDNIDHALANFIANTEFDSVIYAQRVIDTIQKVEHVTDVFIDPEALVEQGVFLAQYNDEGVLGPLFKIERKAYMSSGYTKESTKEGQEAETPTFREALVIKLESQNEKL